MSKQEIRAIFTNEYTKIDELSAETLNIFMTTLEFALLSSTHHSRDLSIISTDKIAKCVATFISHKDSTLTYIDSANALLAIIDS